MINKSLTATLLPRHLSRSVARNGFVDHFFIYKQMAFLFHNNYCFHFQNIWIQWRMWRIVNTVKLIFAPKSRMSCHLFWMNEINRFKFKLRQQGILYYRIMAHDCIAFNREWHGHYSNQGTTDKPFFISADTDKWR